MKRILLLTIGFIMLGVLLIGQDKPKSTEPAKVPPISDALKVKFFKAQAEMLAANEAAQKAAQDAQQKQVTLQGVIGELNKACGDSNAPTLDAQREPACVAKPPTAKYPAAPK